jgi:hypothetical protein
MARYKLTKPFFGAANGHPHLEHFKAGSVIEVADDTPPAHSWLPLCPAARAAVAKHQRPYAIAPNGVQVIDRKTGTVRVTRHNERTPRADLPRSGQPVAALPEPRHFTAADHAAERQAAFKGKELPEVHGADIATEPLRRALERNR